MSSGRLAASGWNIALVVGVVAVVAPLRHEFVPLVDFPEHAATVAALLDVETGGPLAAWYQADFAHTQYWLASWVAARVAPLVGGPVEGLRWLIVAAVVALFVALRRLLHALRLDARLALCALPMVWTRPMTLGFVSFLLAWPLVFEAFAVVAAERPLRWWHHTWLALLAVLVFFLNLTSLVWLCAGALAVSVARAVLSAEGSGAQVRAVMARCGALLILLLPVAWWVLSSSVVRADASRFVVSMSPRFHSPKRILRDAPEWLGNVWTGDLDVVVLVGWLLVVGLLAADDRTVRSRWVGRALVAASLAVWWGLPFERGWLWGLNARFAPCFAMLLPLVWVPRPSRLHSALYAGVLALGLTQAGLVERAAQTMQLEFAGLSAMLRDLPQGKRLLHLPFFQESDVTSEKVFSHASAYHRIWNHGPNEPSFIDLPQSVIHYREGRAPVTRPWPWEFTPENYDNALEGPSYDYVLLRGEGPSFPPAPGALGPAWKLERRQDAWLLYSRVP
ncbi:MAG: hypothetical protein JNG84_08845 [Archangium sp.]|nr:hypothetical protein [Archangium sp.]